MKKGQLLVLILLLIIMSVVVWIGACHNTDNKEEEVPGEITPTPTATEVVLVTPTMPPEKTEAPEVTPTPTPSKVEFPEIKESDFEGLSTKAVEWEAGFHKNEDNSTNSWYNTALDKYIKGYDYVFTKDDSSTKKEIYLTYNISYDSEEYLKQILDILKEHNDSGDDKVYVTFFVQSDCLDWTELMKRIVNEGHECAIRAFPESMATKTAKEIETYLLAIEAKYRALFGESKRMFFYRPSDEFSTREIAVANALGYKVVFYCYKYRDWDMQTHTPTGTNGKISAKAAVLDNFHDGTVIQLSCSELNAKILKELIREGLSQGFSFESLSQ